MPKWVASPVWAGETAAVLASGPSLTRAQVELVKGRCRTIAVNNQGIDTYVGGELVPAMAPWADILYAADAAWWTAYKTRALLFSGLKLTIRRSVFEEVSYLEQSTERVFDPRPSHLATGGNSGYQALHLAVHMGARRIILLGFDMRAEGSKRHWFGDHVKPLHSGGNYAVWIRNFNALSKVLAKKGVEVLNASPKSALECFKKVRLEEVTL